MKNQNQTDTNGFYVRFCHIHSAQLKVYMNEYMKVYICTRGRAHVRPRPRSQPKLTARGPDTMGARATRPSTLMAPPSPPGTGTRTGRTPSGPGPRHYTLPPLSGLRTVHNVQSRYIFTGRAALAPLSSDSVAGRRPYPRHPPSRRPLDRPGRRPPIGLGAAHRCGLGAAHRCGLGSAHRCVLGSAHRCVLGAAHRCGLGGHAVRSSSRLFTRCHQLVDVP